MMLKAPVLPITFGGQKTTGPRRLAAAAGIAALTALSMPHGTQAQTPSQFAEPGTTSLNPSSTDPALNTRIRLEPIRLAIIGLHVLLGVPILPSININGPVSPPATPPALSDPTLSEK